MEDSGFKYAVETPTKIRIQWFHNTGVMIIEFNSTREPRALGLCGEYRVVQEIKAFTCFAKEAHS